MIGWINNPYDPDNDTSSTTPFTIVYRINGCIITNADTITTNAIFVTAPSSSTHTPKFLAPELQQLTPNEKRDSIRWNNQINFWIFLDELFRPRSTIKIKIQNGKDKRAYGTEDGLRPRPMLC